MLRDLLPDRRLVRPEARGDQRLHRIERQGRADGAVAGEQLRELHVAAEHGLVVERALPVAAFGSRRGVGIRAVREAPPGELDVVVFDGHVQIPARSRSVSALR